MSVLLTDSGVRCEFSLTDLSNEQQSSSILLGPSVVSALGLRPNPAIHMCVSIRFTDSWKEPRLFQATLDKTIKTVAIPRHIYIGASPNASNQTCTVVVVEPVTLREIFVSALTDEGYEAARHSDSALLQWFSHNKRIIQQGSTYKIDNDPHLSSLSTLRQHMFHILATEPLPQGVASLDVTQIVLTRSRSSGQHSPQIHHITSKDVNEESDSIEINETFLAGSVLSSLTPATSRVASPSSLVDDRRTPEQSTSAHQISSEVLFKATSLERPISKLDDYTIYVKIGDLGRIGVLNGDWAIIRAHGSSSRRLVRTAIHDEVDELSVGLRASPLLLHNTCGLSTESPTVHVQASPFGSRPPTVPVAKSITIARVASPFSMHAAYQSLFLRGLKEYFGILRRLVKQGDIIPVAINTDAAEEESDIPGGTVDSDIIGRSVSRSNEVVFFLITNVEHNIINGVDLDSTPDIYLGATLGELGCWVDSSITRITQVGVEQSRIPDIGGYLGLGPQYQLHTFLKSRESSLLGSNTPYRKLLSLVSVMFLPHAPDYNLPLTILAKGSRGVGKVTTVGWVAQQLGMHLLEIDCFDIIGETDVKTEGTLRARIDKAAACAPCIMVLRHLDALTSTQDSDKGGETAISLALKECFSDLQKIWMESSNPIVIIGTIHDPSLVATTILSCFKHEIVFDVPGDSERLDTLSALLRETTLSSDVLLDSLAVQTAALVARDLVDLVGRAENAALDRVSKTITEFSAIAELTHIGVALTMADLEMGLSKARSSYSESIGAPKIPNVSWDDVGGLISVKSEILDTIQLPLDHPELFADGLKKRSGILLYGPPGTGKTLLAKAVATSCSLNFFSVKGPELLNMYIGESEANVRRVFQRARDAKPCVIFFDELDSVAPKRGNQGDSGGVMDRIVSQLLAELDGMSSGNGSSDVFVIGATNRPDLLDPALLRPGRFDRMLYLGVSDTHDAQLQLLQALTRKFRLDPELDLMHIAQQCPFNYTGADFYALCADAMLKAMSRKAEEIDLKIGVWNANPPTKDHPPNLTPQYYLAEIANRDEIQVLVSQDDFERALEALVPSVSQSEMEHYAKIQQKYTQQGQTE